MSLFIHNFRNCELICKDTKQISGCLGINGERQIIKGPKTVLELMEMLVILTVVMISEVYTHVKSHQDVHFKCVLFIQCQLHLSKDAKIMIRIEAKLPKYKQTYSGYKSQSNFSFFHGFFPKETIWSKTWEK